MRPTMHLEPFEADERAFIQRRYDKESAQYMYAMKRLVWLTALAPVVVALIYYVATGKTSILYRVYFTGLAFLLLFFTLVAWLSYRHKLGKYRRDLDLGQKVIERVIIESARYMPQTNTYHFFISSAHKLSIEVSEEDFHRLQPGDELSIEYARYCGEYFGYF